MGARFPVLPLGIDRFYIREKIFGAGSDRKSALAGFLPSAKGHVRLTGGTVIDVYHSGLDACSKLRDEGSARSKQRGGQAVARVIRNRNGFLRFVDTNHRENRAENLFLRQNGIRLYAIEHRWLVKVAFPVGIVNRRIAACEQAETGFHALTDIRLNG